VFNLIQGSPVTSGELILYLFHVMAQFKSLFLLNLHNNSACLSKAGWVISRMNAHFQWNLVYKAFHREYFCGTKPIRRQYSTCDLDVANLRPALEHGCRKQTTLHLAIKRLRTRSFVGALSLTCLQRCQHVKRC